MFFHFLVLVLLFFLVPSFVLSSIVDQDHHLLPQLYPGLLNLIKSTRSNFIVCLLCVRVCVCVMCV